MFNFKKKAKVNPSKKAVTTTINEPVVIEVIGASSSDEVWTKEFPNTKNFRGFKRIKLKHKDVDGVDDTLSFYRSRAFDFKDTNIKISCIRTVQDGEEDKLSFDVYVDDKKIGEVPDYNFDGIGLLANTDIDKVCLRVEEAYHADGTVMGQNVYLFVHPTAPESE